MADDRRREDAERYLVPGLQRGLEVLRCFRRDRTHISATELARDLKIPRSTVFRLVTTLEYLGFLARSRDGRFYKLGPAILTLGFEYLASQEITELARPLLEQLRDRTGLPTHMVVRDGREVVFVLKITAPGGLVGSVSLGTRLPAHATVLGRVFLAHMDEAALGRLYPDGALERFSPQTPGSLDALRRILAQDRERGYAVSENFFETGVSAIAAPVFDESGAVVAAINAIARDGAASREQLTERVAPAVVATAGELSRRLGHHDGRPLAAAANF